MDHNTPTAHVRHRWPDRLFHWLMALTTLVLLFSAFLPILGVEIDWIPWHWMAGVCLVLLVVFHVVRALFVHGLGSMLPAGDDFREVFSNSASDKPFKPSKFDAWQKGYHWGVALTVLLLIFTGIPMLIKLDTVLWDRNPGILSDIQWGYVYVVHGLASLLLIFLVLVHLYFSLLPEHKNLLLSMLNGRGPQHVRGKEQQP